MKDRWMNHEIVLTGRNHTKWTIICPDCGLKTIIEKDEDTIIYDGFANQMTFMISNNESHITSKIPLVKMQPIDFNKNQTNNWKKRFGKK